MSENGNLRSRILQQARILLVQEGYAAVSMRKIATAAGCTPTSIYLYFDNKDALIHTLIEEGMDSLHEQLLLAAEGIQDPAARVRSQCVAFMEFGLGNPEYYEIMFLLHPERMSRYPSDKYRRARRSLELLAEELRALPKEVADPVQSATVLWSLLHGATSLCLARRLDVGIPIPAFIDQVVEHASSMLLNRP